MTDPNESRAPLTEPEEDDGVLIPQWANSKKVLGDSTDGSSKAPVSEDSMLGDEDVFEDGLTEKASMIHEPNQGRPRKRVRMFSGSTRPPSLRTRNPSGTPMVAPPWANASFDIGDSPQRLKPYKRQQSCPVMFVDRPDAASLRPPRYDRQRSAPSSPMERDKPLYYRDPPVRRRHRSGGMFPTRSVDLSWANTSIEIGEEPEPEEEEPTLTETLLEQKPDEQPLLVQEHVYEPDEDVERLKLTGDDEEAERAGWGGKMEFLFTCIGYAVGLGNVWRFPYLAYKNGGGAFLVPYIFMLAFVGLPLFFMELCLGQFASLGPISAWKINPLLKGLGYAMVSVSWLIAIYYNVIISHVMLFLFASFAAIPSQLPWISCDNYWNTPDCIHPVYATNDSTDGNVTAAVMNATKHIAAATFNYTLNGTGVPRTPSEEYYNNFVLEQSSGIDDAGAINWKLALCLLLSWTIVLICLIRGIQSLGKVVYFTAIFPYVMLTILLIRGVSLPGAWVGIKFYLKPDFSKLGDSRVWCDAATQIFYSLSACSGGLIAMSSYNKFDNNCYKDSLIVALINCGTSIYSGLVIFSVLGFMAVEKGVDVSEVAAGGPGLAFVVYPEAISRMPVPVMWAIFFFFMMATLGFGSQFSIVECVLSAFTDEFSTYLRGRWQSIAFRTVAIFAMFLLGLPMVTKGGIYLLNLVDYSVSGFPLLVVGFLECAALNWVYTYQRFSYDICLMLGKRPNIYWRVCWCGLTPMIVGFTLLFNVIFYKPPSMDNYIYPDWAVNLGWLITFFPILLIVGFFLYVFCRDGGLELLRKLTKPTDSWGPALEEDRKCTLYDPNFDPEIEMEPIVKPNSPKERRTGVAVISLTNVEPRPPILKNFPKSSSADSKLIDTGDTKVPRPNSDPLLSEKPLQTRVVSNQKVRFGNEGESHV